jgi:hypothetical protein
MARQIHDYSMRLAIDDRIMAVTRFSGRGDPGLEDVMGVKVCALACRGELLDYAEDPASRN